MAETFRLKIIGRVQGVGFRYWMQEEAEEHNVCGWVRNCKDGSVEALVSGAGADTMRFIALCHEGPNWAHVSSVEAQVSDEVVDGDSFEITANQ